MSEQSEKTVIKIDASFLKDSGCSLRMFITLFEQLSYPLVSNDIQFGSAFHYFAAEIFRNNGNFGLALKGAYEVQQKPCEIKFKKDYLSEKTFLVKTCTDWWDWHLEKDNFEILKIGDEVLVEKNFSLKIYEDDDLIIYLCGTIDKIGKFKNGCYGIGDYKTTSSKDPESYFRPYNLSCQLRTYIYAIKQHAILYPDSIWAQLSSTPLVAFIDGIFLMPPSSKDSTYFQRSETFQFKQEDMDEYERLLHGKVNEIVNVFRNWRENQQKPEREGIINGTCEQKFGLCKYASLCMAMNPLVRESVVKQKFVQKVYDPLMFGK